MANKLKIVKPTSVGGSKDIPEGHLFQDRDGDIYLRTNETFVQLTEGERKTASVWDNHTEAYAPYTDLGPIEIER